MNKPCCRVLDGATLTDQVPGSEATAAEPNWHGLDRIVELTVYPRTPRDALLERIRGAELLLTNKVVLDAQALRAAPSLRYVGVLATGTNVVDLDAAKELGIQVTNVPGYATESVVAHVFGLILELEMRITDHSRAVQQGMWSSCPDFSFRLGPTLELADRCLGIVGFGNIGRRVAAIGQAFGMRVLIACRAGRKPDASRLTGAHEFVEVDTIFSNADIISLHCPLVPETHKLVDARRLSLMKPDAILINTGRGPLIDEQALANCLAEGRIRGAGLDVLSVEPPPPDHPLLHAPNCIVTPHIAWATTAARRRLMHIATTNVQAFLDGIPANRVA